MWARSRCVLPSDTLPVSPEHLARLPFSNPPAAVQLAILIPASHVRWGESPPASVSLSDIIPLSALRSTCFWAQSYRRRRWGERGGCVRLWLLGDVPGIPSRLPAAWIWQQRHCGTSVYFHSAKIRQIHFSFLFSPNNWVQKVKNSQHEYKLSQIYSKIQRHGLLTINTKSIVTKNVV